MTTTGPPTADSGTARLAARSWGPLIGVVIVTLILLAVIPIVTTRQVRSMRHALSDSLIPARVHVSEVSGAVAMQMFALGEIAQGDRRAGVARYRMALLEERASMARLASQLDGMGDSANAMLDELRSAARVWHGRVGPLLDSVAAEEAATDTLPADAGMILSRVLVARADTLGSRANEALATLRAADRLERHLDARIDSDRLAIIRVERWNVGLPLLLAPFAAASALVALFAGRRLLALAEEAERGRRALAESAAARATLMRGVTHDLKNPLGAAQGYAALLSDSMFGPLGEEQRRIIGRIRGLIGGTISTIQDLLELSGTTASDLPVAVEPTDIAALTADAVADHVAMARSAGLELRMAPPPPLPPIATDPRRVRQAIGNLLSNAIKYTPMSAGPFEHGPAGEIIVSMMMDGDGAGPLRSPAAAISVRDTGPGIPEEHQARIFDEFYRVPDDRHQTEGSGIGLAISRRSMRRLGGDITMQSVPGKGATFTIWLPAR